MYARRFRCCHSSSTNFWCISARPKVSPAFQSRHSLLSTKEEKRIQDNLPDLVWERNGGIGALSVAASLELAGEAPLAEEGEEFSIESDDTAADEGMLSWERDLLEDAGDAGT